MSDPRTQVEGCAEFQERLPQLFENEIDLSKEAHIERCANCAELVHDLRYIADVAKLLLPIHDPSPAVWDHIKEAMQSPDESAKQREASR